MSAQVAADLRAAADVLERDGWTQKYYTCGDGRHCLMGAVFTVVGDPHGTRNNERADLVRDYLWAFLDANPARWNDVPGRTADEVFVALRAAADRAEASS